MLAGMSFVLWSGRHGSPYHDVYTLPVPSTSKLEPIPPVLSSVTRSCKIGVNLNQLTAAALMMSDAHPPDAAYVSQVTSTVDNHCTLGVCLLIHLWD